jgi:hypothetical protein
MELIAVCVAALVLVAIALFIYGIAQLRQK